MPFLKAHIGHINHVTSGALSAGSESTIGPVANLQHPVGRYRWQTAGVTSSWIQVDAGAAVSWRWVTAHLTNWTAAATWRIMLGTSAGAADVADIGPQSAGVIGGLQQALYRFDQVETARHLRIEIDDPSNPDGNLYVSHLFGGPVFEPAFNWSRPARFGYLSGNRVLGTRGGQEHDLVTWEKRVVDIVFPRLQEAEIYPEIHELDRKVRRGANLLFVPMPGGAAEAYQTIYGRATVSARPTNTAHNLWGWGATISERL